MAAIDFPASPVNGQVFSAPNGVTYIYSSAYTAWQAQPLSAGFVGDFSAYNSAALGLGTSAATMVMNTVRTGNAGGWYNTSNGRYTPPKGRYLLIASNSSIHSSATHVMLSQITKNGAQIAYGVQAAEAVNQWASATLEVVIDANGTDYFEFQSWDTQVGTTTLAGGTSFSAIPISPNANMVQGTGEFQVTHNANFALPQNTSTVLTWNTVLAGNAGGWYNPANGRYTPPAGRYKLTALLSGLSTSGQFMQITLRKNGTVIGPQGNANAGASLWSEVYTEVIVDANGTDWFDSIGFTGGTGTQFNGCFTAFPLSGIKGPQGDPPPGSPLYLYSEQVAAGGETQLNVTIPTNAKRVEIEFSYGGASATDQTAIFQCVESGVPNASNNHIGQQMYASGSSVAGSIGGPTTSWTVAGIRECAASIKFWRRAISPIWFANVLYYMLSNGGTRYVQEWSWDGGANPATTTGFRLTLNSNTFTAGSFMRAYVVT